MNPHLLRLGNGLAIFANYDSRAISPETFVSDCEFLPLGSIGVTEMPSPVLASVWAD